MIREEAFYMFSPIKPPYRCWHKKLFFDFLIAWKKIRDSLPCLFKKFRRAQHLSYWVYPPLRGGKMFKCRLVKLKIPNPFTICLESVQWMICDNRIDCQSLDWTTYYVTWSSTALLANHVNRQQKPGKSWQNCTIQITPYVILM